MEVHRIPGKKNLVPDALSRLPVEDNNHTHLKSPKKEKKTTMSWTTYGPPMSTTLQRNCTLIRH